MKNRKGFTITELVIVIAVIAILATVLIPTFSNMIKKAENSAVTQETRAALTVLLSEKNGSIPNGTHVIYKDAKQEIWFEYNKNVGKLVEIKDTTALAAAKSSADANDEYYAQTAAASKIAEGVTTVAWPDLSKNIEVFINVG